MIEIHRIGDSIGLYDGERCFVIPIYELESFDNAFYKMKREIEKDHIKMMELVIAGGVTHPTRSLEVQIAEIELNQSVRRDRH